MERQFEIPKEHREELSLLHLETLKAKDEFELAKAQFQDLLDKKDWDAALKAIDRKMELVDKLNRAGAAAWERTYELVPGVPREVVCGYNYSAITQEMKSTIIEY